MAVNVQLPQYSMFAATPIYTGISAKIDNVQQNLLVFGLMVDRVVPDQSDQIYIVQPQFAGRLDLLSNNFYATPDLFWVLARVNNLADPEIGFSTGQLIRVPTQARLATLGVLS